MTKTYVALVAAALAAECTDMPSRDVAAPPKPRAAVVGANPVPAGHYVAPSGSASGDGSASGPWDLQTALNQPAAVHPGDTIWLRGGTYSGQFVSYLSGAPGNLVVVRQYPNERATINGNLWVFGSYVALWGFEVTTSTYGVAGVNNRSPGSKLINLVVHDVLAPGIYNGQEATGSEVYGCLCYNNGANNNLDHGIYTEGPAGPPGVVIAENIAFNNWAFGIHAYGQTSSGQTLLNLTMRGNVAFNNNTIAGTTNQGDYLFGGTPLAGDVFDQNYSYRTSASSGEVAASLGRYSSSNQDITITNNYLVGGRTALEVASAFPTATVSGNTLYSPGQVLVSLASSAGETWSGNAFYGSSSDNAFSYGGGATTLNSWISQTGLANPGSYVGSVPANAVFVRPNKYEAGRATIIVYNWANLATVPVDLSAVLSPGQAYTIMNVQDFYGTPTLTGTYAGGTVAIPMAGIPAPAPVGRGVPGPVTGPTFQVFVVRTGP